MFTVTARAAEEVKPSAALANDVHLIAHHPIAVDAALVGTSGQG
jgi:hypothetical protein